MGKYLIAVIAATVVFIGCESVDSAARKAGPSAERQYAWNTMLNAIELGDNWQEIDRQVVADTSYGYIDKGTTGAGGLSLISQNAEEIIEDNDSVAIITKSVFGHDSVEEPVALSITGIFSGVDVMPLKDASSLETLEGMLEWSMLSNGIAVALPEKSKSSLNSSYRIKDPICIYLAANGALLEIKGSGDLPGFDYDKAVKAVQDKLSSHIKNFKGVKKSTFNVEDAKVALDIVQ